MSFGMHTRKKKMFNLLLVCFGFFIPVYSETSLQTIKQIEINGNNYVSREAILNVLSWKEGNPFASELSSQNIKAIDSIGYFDSSQTKVRVEHLKDNQVKVILDLKEKPLLSRYEFEGNNHISTKKLVEKLRLKNCKAVSDHDLKFFRQQIINEYENANYFDVNVDVTTELADQTPATLDVKLNVKEGVKTVLKRVHFVGCKNISESLLRSRVLTREDWLFAFVDNAGKLSNEIIERDKKAIEETYQDYGYLNARVADVKVSHNVAEKTAEATFFIEEGKMSRLRFITLPEEDDEFSQQYIRQFIKLEKDEPYSKKKLLDIIETLKMVYGSRGYIYCDVIPDIKPVDKTCRQLDVIFSVEKGSKYNINDIKISGNQKTKDHVIRRELTMAEGDMATKNDLDISKRRVEALGYFKRNEVDWKIDLVDDQNIDLELNVTEEKTGNFGMGLSFSPDQGSESSSMKLTTEYNKRNMLGMGWDFESKVDVGSTLFKNGLIRFHNPYLCDKPITMNFDVHMSRLEYDRQGEMKFLEDDRAKWVKRVKNEEKKEEYDVLFNQATQAVPLETCKGFTLQFLMRPFSFDRNIHGGFMFGVENYHYKSTRVDIHSLQKNIKKVEPGSLATPITAFVDPAPTTNTTTPTSNLILAGLTKEQHAINTIIANNKFVEGTMCWFGSTFLKDTLNHPLAPSNGWKVELNQKYALPIFNDKFSFIKTELESRAFFPLVGQDRVVLSLYNRIGIITELSKDKGVPYKELYQIGGPENLRGFRWGEAGPVFDVTDYPMGAKNMFLTRVELVMPLTFEKDFDCYTPRGYLFYDLGSGWNTPKPTYKNQDNEKEQLPAKYLRQDSFHLRQTIGFGFKFTNPYPIKVDWGYKLDRKFGSKERPSEVHITMNVPL